MNHQNEPSKEHCLTVISSIASATAFEFHRQRLAKQGYSLSSKILLHQFELVDEEAVVTKLFEGKNYFAATYIKKSNHKAS